MWEKMLQELSISGSNTTIEAIITYALAVDLYKSTENRALRNELEEYFLNTYKTCNSEFRKNMKK